MALQPIIASPLSGVTQPDNYGAPANWVPGNGPPPGMTWSETQGRWMPSDSVQGSMPGPVALPTDNPLPVKFGAEPVNPNPYGFTAPTGPAASVMVPYYNKATGQTWTAPSGGYTPPSADWFQGYPNSQISPGGVMPMPGFAPGMDPVQLPPKSPMNHIATEDPEFFRRAAEQVRLDNAVGSFTPPAAPTNRITTEAPPSQNLLNEIRSTSNQQPYMPIMTGAPQQQPTNNLNLGGLAGLFAFPKAPTNPTIKFGGLNALAQPQATMGAQPMARSQVAPRAGSLPSLRIRPTFKRSLSVPFTRPTFRR